MKPNKFLKLFIVNIIIFSFFSLFQIISIASEISLIQTYEEKLETIRGENKALAIDLVRMNSLSKVREFALSSGFEKTKKAYHIKLLGDVVVAR